MFLHRSMEESEALLLPLSRPPAAARVRAALQLENRQYDWGYSKAVVALDLVWNTAFVLLAAAILALHLQGAPIDADSGLGLRLLAGKHSSKMLLIYTVKDRLLEMAVDEKGENTSIRGADWEVVSLTASVYAAAPAPKAFDPPVESKEDINKEEQVADTAMFMSNHFIFPPDEHKHLLLELDCSEIQYAAGAQGVNLAEEELAEAIKPDDNNLKLKSDDGLHGIQFFDKGKNLSNHGMEFGEGKVLEGFDVAGKEPDIYVDPTFSAFHAKTDISRSVLCDENSDNAESNDLSCHSLEYLSDSANASNLNEENKFDVPGQPCEAWWKRHAMSVYNHAKEANTFWSVFVAAAVMGFVILGQQWQRERLQLQQLKWFTVCDE